MSTKVPGKESDQVVSLQQWLRLALAYTLIPTILFLCAWDPGWWQAWIYTLLIMVVGIGGRIWAEQRNPGLMAERQNVEHMREAKPWDKVLAPLMAISISYPMMIVAGLEHRYDGATTFPLWLNVTGFILIAFGYSFAAWAVAENRFFASVVRIQTERGHEVCDTGPYRFVRHPGYAGNVLALFGIVLALDSIWTLVPALVATIISVVRTALEDKTLQEELPGYLDYSQRTRYRLMPGIY